MFVETRVPGKKQELVRGGVVKGLPVIEVGENCRGRGGPGLPGRGVNPRFVPCADDDVSTCEYSRETDIDDV